MAPRTSLSIPISTAWIAPSRREGKPKPLTNLLSAISSTTTSAAFKGNRFHISQAARHARRRAATSSLYTTYAYDALGRATTTATAVGTTTNAYDDWTTTITDPNGNIKKLTNDAYSRLATVVEKNGATYATTTYAWNANDTLATTTDADGNVRNFTYDGRGLRLTAQDLHDTADGTYGTWTYTYDNAGNLSSFVDPKSQTVNFTYDALNRVLTEDYTGQAGTEIAYGYDSCTNGKPRLCSATSTGAVSTTTYNALGLPATTTMTIDNVFYTTAYQYDRQGNLTNVLYPDSSEVRYAYNTAGLPETVEQKEKRGSFGDIVSDFDYGPHGQVTYKAFGNGVESTYTFDATKLYRLQNILTVAPEGEGLSGGGGMELGFAPDSLASLTRRPARHPLAIAKLDPTAMPENVEELLNDIRTIEHPGQGGPNTEEEPGPAPEDRAPEEEPTSEEPPAEDMPEPVEVQEPGEEAPSEEPQASDGEPLNSEEEQEISVIEQPPAVAPGSIEDALEGKTAAERADIKAAEIAKIGSIPRTERGDYDIEIVSMNAIDGGVAGICPRMGCKRPNRLW